MKGKIAATTALVFLLLTLDSAGAEAKVCQWVTPLDVVCQHSTCLPYCIKKGYTDGYCTQRDRKCACTKECTGEVSSGDDRPTLGEEGWTWSKLQSMEQMNDAEAKQRVPCLPGECDRSCKSQCYRRGYCRGGGVIPEYCVCVNNYTNFMVRKEGSGGGDVSDGGGEALFLEEEAMSP